MYQQKYQKYIKNASAEFNNGPPLIVGGSGYVYYVYMQGVCIIPLHPIQETQKSGEELKKTNERTNNQTNKQTNSKQTNKQTNNKQTANKQTSKQANKQTNKTNTQTNKQHNENNHNEQINIVIKT